MNLNKDKKEDTQKIDNNLENREQNTNNINENNNQKQSINNNELIIKEINDICNDQKQLIKKNNLIQKKDFFELEITVLKEMIQTEKNISLLIIIPFTYPKSEPEIYCLTDFCSPHICDGRNLLTDIIRKPWQRKVHTIDFIINKLPGFFLTFNESRKKNKQLIVGKFTLNKYYSINRLKEMPIYFHLITHKEKKFTFKTIKTHKIITISEISFCMFELDNNHSGYCKLIFFSDLKDLISTKLDNKKNEIEIKWRNPENDKKNIKIEIVSPNSENINNILLNNQAEFFKYFKTINNENNINSNIKKISFLIFFLN
jgi:ubiquitin-protein ligase